MEREMPENEFEFPSFSCVIKVIIRTCSGMNKTRRVRGNRKRERERNILRKKCSFIESSNPSRRKKERIIHTMMYTSSSESQMWIQRKKSGE